MGEERRGGGEERKRLIVGRREGEREEGRRVIVGEGGEREKRECYTKAQTRCVVFGDTQEQLSFEPLEFTRARVRPASWLPLTVPICLHIWRQKALLL